MNLGYLVENCKYYSGETYRRKACPCMSCAESVRASQESMDLHRRHINGKVCEQANNCPACCEIKWAVRMLNHYAFDGEQCTRKCEVCSGQYNEGVYKRLIQNIPRTFYRRMLPGKRKSRWA